MYCTIDDLKKVVPLEVVVQLTDDESVGAVVAERVVEAIAQADAEIDAYCGAKYAVPFVVVPEAVRKCSVDMAVYNLYCRRVEKMPDTRADRYKNAVRLLEGIAKGTVSIGADPEPAAATGGDGIGSTREKDGRTITCAGMEGF